MNPRRTAALATLLLAVMWPAAHAVVAPDLTPDEVRRIARHGPWPPPAIGDAGNRHGRQAAAIALGQKLFFDTRLSAKGDLACASCHQPGRAFGDGAARSTGAVLLTRNAPSLWNAAQQRWYGWDGASDSLWSQAIRPLLDPAEMAGSAGHIRATITGDPDLACRYQRVFGEPAGSTPTESVLVRSAKAIGAFVASLRSAATPFDRFRTALLRRDHASAVAYPAAALQGLKLFVGKGGCANCHSGAMFSNGEFADTGVSFFVHPGVVDPGRHAGIVALRASPYNLLGVHADAPTQETAIKTRHVDLKHRNFGEFKVPSLRNVAQTAPYMHDGQLATLEAVINHYSELNLDRLHADGETLLKPLHLAEGEKADLLAFLQTLSVPDVIGWQPRPLSPCKSRTGAVRH